MRPTSGIAAAVLALAVAGCSPATEPAATRPTPADLTTSDRPAGTGATRPETVSYDDAGHEMDIYRPAAGTASTMVLLVHGVGAGTSPKDHPGFAAWGTRLAEAGIVAAIPDFDAVIGGSDAGTAQLGRAISVLRERVAGPGGEPPDLVTMGFSAGGPDWVAASFDPANQPVSALVGYYADIEPDAGASDLRSLSARLARAPRPLLLAYGDRDDAPGILASLRAFRRAGEPGRRTTILTHPGAGHAFDLDHDPRTRAIIRRTVEFIATLGRG